jgi:hypothetical protein
LVAEKEYPEWLARFRECDKKEKELVIDDLVSANEDGTLKIA